MVANKSKEQSEAQTVAETARALAIAAEEKVTTARAIEIAERDKIINVIAARKVAETDAMPITVMAEAEKQAAANKAEAIRRAGQGRCRRRDHPRDRRQDRSVRPRPRWQRSRRRPATS